MFGLTVAADVHRLAETDPDRALELGITQKGVHGFPDYHLRQRAVLEHVDAMVARFGEARVLAW